MSASLDSTSFFPEMAVGAWEATGVAAMFGAAKAFKNYTQTKEEDGSLPNQRRTPVFLGFYGETFGFAGSHMFLEDVLSFTCAQPANFTEEGRFLSGCLDPYMPSLRFQQLNKAWYGHVHIGPVCSRKRMTGVLFAPRFCFHLLSS